MGYRIKIKGRCQAAFCILALIYVLLSSSAFADVLTLATNQRAYVRNISVIKTRSVEWFGGTDRNYRASGIGVVVFYDKGEVASAYWGQMFDGAITGTAVAIYPKTGMAFVGEINRWNENGYGFMRFCDGSYYEGDWSSGDRHGDGLQTDSSGRVIFQGEFNHGVPVGHAPIPTPTIGARTNGRILTKFASSKVKWFGGIDGNGLADGIGVVTSKDSSGKISGIYQGSARSGVFEGTSIAIYAKANQAYFGGIRDWNENGRGQMFYPDGSSWSGEWVESERVQRVASAAAAPQLTSEPRRSPETPINKQVSGSNLTEGQMRAISNLAVIGLTTAFANEFSQNTDPFSRAAAVGLKQKRFYNICDLVQQAFPEWSSFEIKTVSGVIALIIDGKLTSENFTEQFLRTNVINVIKSENPNAAQETDMINFIYLVLKTYRK